MKRSFATLITLIALLLALASVANATPHYTNVTVTLTDNNGQVWKGATWQTIFIPPFGNPSPPNNNGVNITPSQSGVADNTGTFTVTLDDNLVVSPAGTEWNFVICPNATVRSCSAIPTIVTGATQNLSASISSQLIIPIVNTQPTLFRAYNDGEAFGGFGALYVNTVDNSLRQCNLLLCNGTGWNIITVVVNNPVFTGTLTVPCVKFNFDASNDTTVCSQGATGHINVTLPAVSGTLALLASPAFTGVPTAPTATTGDNSTTLATTAFVKNQNYITSAGVPVTSVFSRTGAILANTGDYSVAQVTGAAPLASPTFTGVPIAPTNGTATDSTTQLATDAFVQSAITASTTVTGRVVSLTTNTGQAIGATPQTWITKATTMPASGCPCRAIVSYSMMFTAGASGTVVCWIDDNNGSGNVFATDSALTNTAGGHSMACGKSSISPVTYANGATVTFVGRGDTDASGGITVASGQFGSTQASWLSIVVITSN